MTEKKYRKRPSRKPPSKAQMRELLANMEMPTPDQIRAKQHQRLDRDLDPEGVGKFVAPSVLAQLHKLVDTNQIYPANAVKYLRTRSEIFSRAELPAPLLQTTREQLPKKTAADEVDYSPVDYLATVFRGAPLFPLIVMAKIQRWKAGENDKEMDPIVRREAARKGLLSHTRSLTKLDPRAADVRMLRGASYPLDVIGLVKAASRCEESDKKRALFKNVARTRLRAKAERYGGKHTATELHELTEEENLDFILTQLHSQANEWVDENYPPEASVSNIGDLKLEDYLRVFESNVFWFADWPDEQIEKYLDDFEVTFRQYIRGALFWERGRKIKNYASLILKSESKVNYIEMYLGKPVREIIEEEATAAVGEEINSIRVVFEDTLAGGDFPEWIVGIVEDVIKEFEAGKDEQEVPEAKAKKEEVKGEDVDVNDEKDNVVELFPAQKEIAEAAADVLEEDTTRKDRNLAIIINQLIRSLEFIPDEMQQRFFQLCHRIADAYITETISNPDVHIDTGDLLSSYKKYTKFYDLFKVYRRMFGEQKARTTINRLIDTSINELPDEEFAEVYNRIWRNHGPATFARQVFSETYMWVGAEQTNSLPASRARVVGLMEKQPGLFDEKLLSTFQRWKQKQDAEE